MYLIWLLLRSSTLCLFSCLYTYIYFSYLPLVFLVTQYYGTYEVEWFYDQCVIKKKKWIEGWGRCLLWGTVSEFEVLSPNLRYCLWIWGTVSEFEVLSLNLRYFLWIWGTFSEFEVLSLNLRYCLWIWGTVSEFEVLSLNLRYCLWIWGTVSEFEVLSLNLPHCIHEKDKNQWQFKLSL